MNNVEPLIIILFGRSGCGKGTQAKLLQREYHFDYLGSGDVIRARAKKNDFAGKKIRNILSQGARVPTYLMFQLWSLQVEKFKRKKNFRGLIIDGSPRTAVEAKLMDEVFDWFEWSQVKIFLLDVSEEVSYHRLINRRLCPQCGQIIPFQDHYKGMTHCDLCGVSLTTRSDDQPASVRARLDFFKKDVEPAVDYYKQQQRLIVINGEQSIDAVYQDLKKHL